MCVLQGVEDTGGGFLEYNSNENMVWYNAGYTAA